MAFNIKPILEQVRFTRPKNLFEYMLYYPVPTAYSDEIILYKMFNPQYWNSDVLSYLQNYEWFGYIYMNSTDFPLPLTSDFRTYESSDAITDCIFNNFSKYELLPKITDLFTETLFDIRDRNFMRAFVDGIVGNVLFKNAEKYEKLFKAMTLEFNPLWNVDGTETTIRTLERDGTETLRRTGTVADAKTGTDATAKTGTTRTLTEIEDTLKNTGTDTHVKTGTEATVKTGTITDAKSGTETTAHTGTDNHTKNGEESTTTDTGKSAFNSATMTPTESVESVTQYTNVQDNETVNLTDLLTLNSSNTETHNTTDTLTHNVTDMETLNTQDAREIENDETVTHNTTDTTTHNTTDTNTLDTIDTERIEHTRQGNIGVTTTTKLLTEYVDFAKYIDFVYEIAHDIVSELCYMA